MWKGGKVVGFEGVGRVWRVGRVEGVEGVVERCGGGAQGRLWGVTCVLCRMEGDWKWKGGYGEGRACGWRVVDGRARFGNGDR